jgi:hypothetical protein
VELKRIKEKKKKRETKNKTSRDFLYEPAAVCIFF